MTHPYLETLLWAAATVVFILLSSLALAAAARQVVRWRGADRLTQDRTFAGYLFAAPWIVGFVIFVVAPMLASLYWSFTTYKPPAPPVPVGPQNYVRILTEDKDFRSALFNTLYLAVCGLPLQLSVALGLALLLSRRLRGERLFRMAFYLPVVLGLNAAVLLSWRLMFNANNGLVNTLLRGLGGLFPPFNWLTRVFIYGVEISNAFFFGLQNSNFTQLGKIAAAGFPAAERVPLWLQSPLWTKTSLLLLMVWGCGAMMLIYLAALTNVPRELHEAAEVDGANGWQKFRHITLPLISPATFYNLVVGTITTLQIFEQPYVLFRDSPTVAQSAYTVVYTLWRQTFRFNEMGYGAAISWILLVIILVITLIQFRLQGRWVQYDLK
jgi:multiple sugar transport system permease protein